MTRTGSAVDRKVCRKKQGKAEAGNSCLSTPGMCESCPDWGGGGKEIRKKPVNRGWKPTNKERLDIYDRLREAHKHIQKIYQKYPALTGLEENAVDAVDSVLYLAEGEFAKPE